MNIEQITAKIAQQLKSATGVTVEVSHCTDGTWALYGDESNVRRAAAWMVQYLGLENHFMEWDEDLEEMAAGLRQAA